MVTSESPRDLVRLAVVLLAAIFTSGALAQSAEELAEMAKKAQDPLGDTRAIMTDNTIAFDGGPDDSTSYGFQIQPVYSIKNDTSYNMIARAVIPVIGVEPGVVLPPIGPEPRPDDGSNWGIGDTILQYFFSPKNDSAWKWGVGPQVSLRTHTSSQQAGPGWGGGVAAVLFGGVGNWALGLIGMQHWGQDDFNVGTLQAIAMYNFESMPGVYLGYNNSITFNWEAESGNRTTLPLGATFGKTLLLKSGNGLDLNIGAYRLVERPEDSPEWQLKFGISYFFN